MPHLTYVTFGQIHTHSINGKTLDTNCVAVIKSEDAEKGREIVFQLFGSKFCMEYPEDYFDPKIMRYFPRGLIYIN